MDTMEKCLKETKKGITIETFKSGESKGVKATNEKGSVQYPCNDSIADHPELLKHPY